MNAVFIFSDGDAEYSEGYIFLTVDEHIYKVFAVGSEQDYPVSFFYLCLLYFITVIVHCHGRYVIFCLYG
jgi:hypothetical protein